ncbi:hypothetical protein [Kordiimonas marina]|uniref:hypothetical protein n=1 Tax=Kordiimonas marina TaxID=2872312 RepID=UPI001FF4308C|nr:hypothetical protein [Kordiimonas marina]MCJ9429682.1 hypothetical protein [Kordiimonas marina]
MSAFDMNALDSRIRELVAYARERDGEDRTALFRNLVDLFLTGKAPSREPTRSQLLDVIEALLPHVEVDSRRTAADLVAKMSAPPLDLALRLARDRASLAEDLLKTMPFDEDAFIELIAATGREHHQILASRADLSANVWIALARAAPAAPPFDSRSTLALWRDDLGNGQERSGATVTMLHPDNEAVAAATAWGTEEAEATGTDGMTAKMAEDAPKSASLRILRTGEDLLADRASQPADLPETRMAETRMAEADDEQTSCLPAEAPSEQPAPDAAASEDTYTATPREQLRDPGPGGWCWRSDRDGIVTDVSPHGRKLLDGHVVTVGASMLDLLGLNTKLGHPVSRAFQRRSAIHDAPITLDGLDRAHRFWTLDAAPLFGIGGVFEGYEGALTPVVAAEDPLGEPALHVDDQPLFLDDVTDRRPRPIPQTFTDRQSVLAESAAAPAHEPAPRASLNIADKSFTDSVAEQVTHAAADAITKATLDAVADMVSGSHISAVGPEVPAAHKIAEETPERLDLPPHLAEITSTLDLLEEALARLGEGSRKSGNMQLRLQAEIATACARSLREQLGDKADD